MSGGTPFPIDSVLTGVVVNYRNAAYVADLIFPRLQPRLTKEEFKWLQFNFNEQISPSEGRVGRKSEPDLVEFSGEEKKDSTDDFGFDAIIPLTDISNAPAGYNPLTHASQRLMDFVLLRREKRASNLAFNPATYAAGNKEVLAGTSQWSHADSTPIQDFQQAKDTMVMDPNSVVLGRGAWSALRTNQQILKAISISGTQEGMATKQAVADLLELDEIIVGQSWLNGARPGQPAVRQRTWGNHALLFHKSPLATSMSDMPTFGWTAEFGGPVSGSIPEPKIGLRGSERVRAGESVKEVVAAPDLGYFFQNAAA